MASSLIPPIDFSRSGSSFATAVTTSDTPPCDCNDDDDSEYATTLASTAPEELARAPSSTPSIQQDQLFASANSTEWADDVPFEAAKNRFLSRLFSRHGTVSSPRAQACGQRQSKKLVKRAPTGSSSDAQQRSNSTSKRTRSTASKTNGEGAGATSYRVGFIRPRNATYTNKRAVRHPRYFL